MAKKQRSAKQKANDRRLGRMAKARARKSTPKRRKSRRKVNKPRKRRSNVAKKRRSSSKRSFVSKIPLVNNPTVKKVATGIGLATIGATVINLVAPQIARNPIVKPALAFIGGGVEGLIGQVVIQGGASLGNIFGGGNGGGATNASNGFA